MPLQNRVDPYSQLHAVSARGTFMGNRGRLHNAERQIISLWKSRPWITCALSFKERKRKLMAPDSYTELFFLDEPTAYAAGHRPCAECRRPAYKQFKEAWARAFPQQQDLSAKAIDHVLHAARLNADGSQWRWSFAGYSPLQPVIPAGQEVTVLTPEPIVRLFKAGLTGALAVHPSIEVGRN